MTERVVEGVVGEQPKRGAIEHVSRAARVEHGLGVAVLHEAPPQEDRPLPRARAQHLTGDTLKTMA